MLTRRSKTKIAAALAVPILASVYWLFAYAAIPDMDEQPIGYVGALDMSNYNLASGTAVAYRGDYFRGTWDGDLIAYNISADTSVSVTWQARDQLANQDWLTGRKIFTMGANGGIPFSWTTTTTSLTAEQQTQLGGDPQGRYLLNFTRGDNTYEGGAYRKRYSKLGDIVHSRPLYYKHSSTVERVYVGANDGMLHAFDAKTGNEVFAYIPSLLIPKLRQYAINPYVNHKYGVDGLMSIGQVTSGTSQMTLLAAGMGAGGNGVFALDVSTSNPADESAAAGMAKWEAHSGKTSMGNMGHVFGVPLVTRLQNGEHVVLVPNGINSSAGKASLFVLSASTGAVLSEIMADAQGPDNGLTAISAADLNNDGKVDVAYGGDLKGTLWKFDLSTTSYPSAASAVFQPASADARAIVAAPALSAHPAGGVMVNFGTGRMLTPDDITDTSDQYLYGIWDSTRATSTTLAQVTLSTAVTSGTPTLSYRVANSPGVNYSAGAKGWRVVLKGGERSAGGDTFTDSGRFVLTTVIPDANTSTHGAWLLELDALTGNGPSKPFFDISGDNKIDLAGNTDKVVLSQNGTSSYVAPAGKFLGTGVWSQPILAQVNQTFDLSYFNQNPNQLLPSIPLTTSTTTTTTTTTTNAGPGVAGGHFDFDIYYNVCNAQSGTYNTGCTSNTHVHEYDDKYDVIGVNLLAASESDFNLSKAISKTTTFKIMLANQKLSPAARVTVGTTTLMAWDWPTSPQGFLSDTSGGAAKTFTLATIGRLVIALPVDAFSEREWIPGSGDKRAGLVPTITDCVRQNSGAQGNLTGYWMNGALTMQIVKANTNVDHVELSTPAESNMGHRLKKDDISQAQQLAQYTMFWHYKDRPCTHQQGWSATPPPITASSNTKVERPDEGADDPKGAFLTGSGALTGGSGSTSTTTGTTKSTYNGQEAYTVTTYDAATDSYTTTVYAKSDNRVLATKTEKRDLLVDDGDKQIGSRARLGRLSWREVIR
jgi:Neisseria PilC beta-propeller domain